MARSASTAEGETPKRAGPRVLRRQRAGAVLVLTLDRPEARNALSPELMSSLDDALRGAADDDGVGAVVITGAGDRAFCVGMDLRAFSEAMGPGGSGGADFGKL